MKITTTVQKLDDVLKGGIEEGSNVLIISDMLIDKSRFGLDILSGALPKIDSGLYFVNNKFPDFVKGSIKNWGRAKKKISLIDGFSYTAGRDSREEFQIKVKVTDIKSYTNVIRNVVSDAFHKKSREKTLFLFDSLDYWIGSWKLMEDMIKEIRKNAAVHYYLIADVGLNAKETNRLQRMFDYVIFLRIMKGKSTIIKEISVLKPATKMKIQITD